MRLLLLFITVFLNLPVFSQYYLRGVLKDENGVAVYNAKILLLSKGPVPFYTGSSGAFGIPLSTRTDSIIFIAAGYETLRTVADAGKFNTYTLIPATEQAKPAKYKLNSLVSGSLDELAGSSWLMGETYTSLVENGFTEARKYPQTGFSLNTNRASYSNIRRFLNNDMRVPPDAVHIEEMVNYFNLAPAKEKNTDSFSCTTSLTETPWNSHNRLLFIKLQAPYINLEDVPPAKLVLLVDVSGSMEHPGKLPLLKDAFKMLVNNLREKDTIAIVIYGGIVATYLPPVSCRYKDSIYTKINNLHAGGETPGADAITKAYGLAEKMYRKENNNRVILATDGDFNVGQSTDKELETLIAGYSRSGIYLTCLGVGMGNYKNSKLEVLAKKGNGNFAYIDNPYEAEKVLTAEFTKTMYTVANDAYMHVIFEPAYVKRYRLLGYDNKKEFIENNNAGLEGGEVGSGHSLTAIYEIEPATGMPEDIWTGEQKNIAQLKLHYKMPVTANAVEKEFNAPADFKTFNTCDSALRLATAVLMFGGILKQSASWENIDWDNVIDIAKQAAKATDYAQQELLMLLEKARLIYEPSYRKKRKKNNNN